MKLEFGIPSDKEAVQLRLGIERGFFVDERIDLTLQVVFGGQQRLGAFTVPLRARDIVDDRYLLCGVAR